MDQKQLSHNFVNFLEQNYTYAQPKIMASNVFYSYCHHYGIDFWDIFQSEASLLEAKELLILRFEKINRKNPKGHASVHLGCWVKFKEFLDTTYGGVEKAKKLYQL